MVPQYPMDRSMGRLQRQSEHGSGGKGRKEGTVCPC